MDATETPTNYGSQLEDKLLPGPSVLLARSFLYVVVLLAASAGAWATITELDVVVNARGRVTVEGEPIRVTPPEPGLLVELPVQIGDRVVAGDLLLRLDSFKYRSEVDQINGEILTLRAEARRHRGAAEQIRATASFVQREGEEIRATASFVQRELDARSAMLVIIEEQLARVEELIGLELAPVSDADEKKLELAEGRAGIAALETQLQIIEEQLAGVETQFQQRADEATERERQAIEADARAEALVARLSQLGGFAERLTVAAPVSGTVTDLAVLHPGSVLDTDQPAVVITPRDQPLRVSIQIPNASMQRLRVGLPVRMRFDAYPYQDFGDLGGELLEIEPDADINGEFRAWVSLAGTTLEGPRGTANVGSGLQLDAEIIVDRRTVIDFLLKPLRRLGDPIRVSGG